MYKIKKLYDIQLENKTVGMFSTVLYCIGALTCSCCSCCLSYRLADKNRTISSTENKSKYSRQCSNDIVNNIPVSNIKYGKENTRTADQACLNPS